MKSIDAKTARYVFGQITNGFVFEDLAKELVAAIDGTEFLPVGGTKDRGIDGLELQNLYEDGRASHKVYQFSIEANAKRKIIDTIEALRTSNVNFQRLVYITNATIGNADSLVDEIYNSYSVFLQPRDIQWLSVNVNANPRSIAVFRRFEENNIHVLAKPDEGFELINVKDPRIYVYLRHQVEKSDYDAKLDELLIDTLIFLALDDTDPDKDIFRTKDEIIELITSLATFDRRWLNKMVSRRLEILSAKPLRKVKHHRPIDSYCLPYETRRDLAERQIQDKLLYQEFINTTQIQLQNELDLNKVIVREPLKLLQTVLHKLFQQQGLEFSQFVATGDGSQSVDKSLVSIVDRVVEDSSVVPKNRPIVKIAVLNVIRAIIYRGTPAQTEFLRKLADTYRMLFLLQCDPQLASYFEVMAGKLTIYVDTSILIPAMSEYFLDARNRRYTNLLICARDAGINLVVNNVIVSELAAHLRGLQKIFYEFYEGREDLYDYETALVYVPEIMIRAYFYAKLNRQVENFKEFYENFLSWHSSNAPGELVEWLKGAYGVRYVDTKTLGLVIDPNEEETLTQELRKYKSSDAQARTDAKQLLMIYAIREKNNELGEGGVFGFSTWWLTSDQNSQLAFRKIADSNANRVSPYIRADFLYNYITLVPNRKHIDEIFEKVFPTVLGVNISFHIPSDLCDIIQSNLASHKNLVETPRFRAQLRAFTEQLKSNPQQWDRHKIESWFNQRAREITHERNRENTE